MRLQISIGGRINNVIPSLSSICAFSLLSITTFSLFAGYTYSKWKFGAEYNNLNNGEKFFDFKITPWKYPNDFVGGVVIVATDVTSIKVNERNLELTNIKLSRLNEELAQFAYRTSHDLKAPLATIKGLTDFIEEDLESGNLSEVKLNVKQVFRHASKLETLVVDILNLAKTDLEKQSFDNVDIAKICTEIKESYSDLLNEKKVEFRFSFEENLIIWSQETRLRQILGNLVVNSIKYSDLNKETRFVTVTCKVGKDILFTVSDNGIGIDTGDRGTLFDMFSRFNTELADGSGLGMSIVKKNIDALNGKIELSNSNVGTLFHITLPIIKREL